MAIPCCMYHMDHAVTDCRERIVASGLRKRIDTIAFEDSASNLSVGPFEGNNLHAPDLHAEPLGKLYWLIDCFKISIL